MARLRTIKPEFWSSEQIMELEPLARLAFIGLLNFCDDGGVHPASLKTLKAELFPSDDLAISEITSFVEQMIGQGLVIEFKAEGKQYWHVTGWQKHQRIDKPTFRHPRPCNSSNVRRILDQSSTNDQLSIVDQAGTETSGVETKGNIPSSGDVGNLPTSPDQIPNCPHTEVIELYKKHLPMLAVPKLWQGKRVEALRARWRWVLSEKKLSGDRYATDLESGLLFFDRFFAYAAESDFLTGRNGKWTRCDLAWMISSENFIKILEGKYNDHQAAA